MIKLNIANKITPFLVALQHGFLRLSPHQNTRLFPS